jgi:hypothetical protein
MSVPLKAERARVDDPDRWVKIITGSGFVVSHLGGYWLVTNGHVLTGRNRVDETPLGFAALPSRLRVSFSVVRGNEVIGAYSNSVDLYANDGRAIWQVHPTAGRKYDVVAMPLPPASHWKYPGMPSGASIRYIPYSAAEPADPMRVEPATDLSVIGFPYELSAGGAALGVWSRGTVASEPGIDYGEEPCFLIDSRTREGQSGSPVIAYWQGTRVSADGSVLVGTGSGWELQGIYSGRISEQSDLGRVWKRSVIREVIEGGVRDTLMYE